MVEKDQRMVEKDQGMQEGEGMGKDQRTITRGSIKG